MEQRGIRGAITIENNTEDALRQGVVDLLSELKLRNKYDEKDISHVIFTLTSDINCVYPAKIAREEFEGWDKVPMMCFQELSIENSLEKCLRILIVINTNLGQDEIKHIYLKGAANLRKDIKQ